MSKSFGSDFRRFFIRGLAAVLPTILTLALLVWFYGIINDYVGRYISEGAKWVTVRIYLAGNPSATGDQAWTLVKQAWHDYRLDVAGFLLAILLIYIVGLLVASLIGRTIWRGLESLVKRVPVVKRIYPFVKQVTDFVFSEKRVSFSRVVALEYPRKGIWSIGLVTNIGMHSITNAAGSELLTVFIPSSPTPVTGYTIAVRREEVIDLPISVDEAIRYLVSGGVILPMAEIGQGVSNMVETEGHLPAEGTAALGQDGSTVKEI